MNRLNWFFLLIVTVLLIPAEKATAKKKTEKCDREIWCEVMYRMAAPVLSNMTVSYTHLTLPTTSRV